jgi:hypothetical protein
MPMSGSGFPARNGQKNDRQKMQRADSTQAGVPIRHRPRPCQDKCSSTSTAGTFHQARCPRERATDLLTSASALGPALRRQGSRPRRTRSCPVPGDGPGAPRICGQGWPTNERTGQGHHVTCFFLCLNAEGFTMTAIDDATTAVQFASLCQGVGHVCAGATSGRGETQDNGIRIRAG